MRARAGALLVGLALSGCAHPAGDQLPPGTFAGSTSADRPFVLDVSDTVTVNRHKARLAKDGVLRYTDGGVTTTMTCRVRGRKREELRCTVKTAPSNGASPTTEVIDLMLL